MTLENYLDLDGCGATNIKAHFNNALDNMKMIDLYKASPADFYFYNMGGINGSEPFTKGTVVVTLIRIDDDKWLLGDILQVTSDKKVDTPKRLPVILDKKFYPAKVFMELPQGLKNRLVVTYNAPNGNAPQNPRLNYDTVKDAEVELLDFPYIG